MSFSHLLDPVSHILCHPLKPTSRTPFLMLSSQSYSPCFSYHPSTPLHSSCPHHIPHAPHFVSLFLFMLPVPYPHFLSFHPHSLLLSLFLRSLHSSSSPPSHYNAPPSSSSPPSIHPSHPLYPSGPPHLSLMSLLPTLPLFFTSPHLLKDVPQFCIREVTEWVQVVPHCTTEEHWVLRNDGHLLPEVVQPNLLRVHSINHDGSKRLSHPVEYCQERRLPSTCTTHNANLRGRSGKWKCGSQLIEQEAYTQ